MSYEKLTFAVVGAGHWGPNIIRNLASLPRAQVRWVVDRDELKLNAVRAQFPGVGVLMDAAEAFRDPKVDAVVICTPTSSHYALAKAALNRGKHVLVEKPITTRSWEAWDLAECAARAGTRLMAGHVYLFHPHIHAMKYLIRAGGLGVLRHFRSVRENHGPIREDVGAFWDLAPHDLSILLFLLEETPVQVMATAERLLGNEREDAGKATLLFSGGLRAEIQVNWLAPAKKRTISLEGSGGDYWFDEMDRAIAPTVEPLRSELEAFIDWVLDGVPHPNNASFAADVVTLLECIEESARLGGKAVPGPMISRPSLAFAAEGLEIRSKQI